MTAEAQAFNPESCNPENFVCPEHSGVDARLTGVEKKVDKLDDRFWAILVSTLFGAFASIGTLLLLLFKMKGG